MIDALIQDRYRIDSELGRGGMGVVYRAQDTLLERPVAIKVVSATGLGTKGQSRLLQEARAAARLNNPHIVAIYDVGQAEFPDLDGETSYIVMELVEGQTLRDYQVQDMDQIIRIAIDICDALTAAHSQGIIHRDLKPENVTISLTDTVKLMDFGLARISGKSRLTEQGALMGTLSYLAPEIILGQEADSRSDLYALGVMLYEMAAGRPPFEADNLTAVLSQHMHAPIVPPSAYNDKIPSALDKLIEKLLSKKPKDRPPSAEAVRQSLEDLGPETVDPYASGAGPQLNRLVRGRMIGREEEFGQAVSLWQKSAAGHGQFLLLSGEPGIGKTRMVKELTAYAEISGGKTLMGLCYAEERTPYGPISQMVARSLEDGFNLNLPEPVLADLLTLAPELRLTYPEIPPNERLDPEAEQQRLFDSIITWFSAISRAGQLLLIVDDLHWADSGSLSLLRHLARRLGRRRALLAATYREVELDEALPFHELLNDLIREHLATRIKLSRLSKEQTERLLATLFDEEITPDFLDGIYRETEGNPFFVEEVCKALVDSGELYFEGGRWHRPAMGDLAIPQGIRVAIQSRLGKLSKEEQSTLQVAALLGRDFEFDMLVAVSDLDEDDLIDVLESADEAQLIEEVRRSGFEAVTTFTFTHALIHSTLLSNLKTLRRQRLQRRIALSLEEAFPDRRRELAPLLGRYFAEAGDEKKAVDYLLQAGDDARQLYAYKEAIEAYEGALIFLREGEDYQRTARTLMKLGLTYHNSSDFEASRRAYDDGFIEWQRAANDELTSHRSLPSPPHPFRIVNFIPPRTLDASYSSDNWSGFFIDHLFSGLLYLTGDDELVPDVAQRWEVLDEGKRYLFHLRRDVAWSDGTPVTAGDFEFAWKRRLDPKNDQGLPEQLYDIKGAQAYHQGLLGDPAGLGVKALDDFTLEVILEISSSYFLQLMAIDSFVPLPKHAIERYGNDWVSPEKIVSNGPFQIKNSLPDEVLSLKRNPDYHGHFEGNLLEVELFVVSAHDMLELYERDAVDLHWPYAGGHLESGLRAIQTHLDEYISTPSANTQFLNFDTSRPPFDNPLVRQSLGLAIDRDSVISQATKGAVFPALGGLVPPGIPGHLPGIALPYDPQLARQKIAEAGYPRGRGFPHVEFVVNRWSNLGNHFDAFIKQWEINLAIQITYRELDFNDYLDFVRSKNPHMWYGGWMADYPDPDSFLRVASWLQQTGWRNDDYMALIRHAREVVDRKQRLDIYRQAELILVKEAPIIPIGYGRIHILVKPWVTSLPTYFNNWFRLKETIIEPH